MNSCQADKEVLHNVPKATRAASAWRAVASNVRKMLHQLQQAEKLKRDPRAHETLFHGLQKLPSREPKAFQAASRGVLKSQRDFSRVPGSPHNRHMAGCQYLWFRKSACAEGVCGARRLLGPNGRVCGRTQRPTLGKAAFWATSGYAEGMRRGYEERP